MQARRFYPLFLLPPLCLPSIARAEGTDQLNTSQALRQTTQLYVDAEGDGSETLLWEGQGSVWVSTPDGFEVASLTSGQDIVLSDGPGAYGVYIDNGQQVGTRWDLALLATHEGTETEQLGRVFSYDWKFNAGAFSSNRATYGSFYALVPGGAPNTDAVVELKLDGLAGYVFNLSANRVGVDGDSGGRSVPQDNHSVTPEFPIYLSPPARAVYGRIAPDIVDFNFAGGVGVDIQGNPIAPCQQLIPGATQGRFFFTTNVEGSYHLECDLDADGVMDGGLNDLLLIGSTSPGTNLVFWNGENGGQPVSIGTYQCQLSVNVGEFHYVGRDIESSYPGLRLYEVQSDLTRSALNMHWNDELVQTNAQAMPNGLVGLSAPDPGGMSSGSYSEPALPNVSARSWGNFNSNGKGNEAFLDTFVWMESTSSTSLAILAVDGQLDSDGDGLSDFEEECSIGSNPDSTDTDGNGIADGEQYSASSSGIQGGLESHGGLGSTLARRAVEHTRRSPWNTFALNSNSPLSRWVPELPQANLVTVNATPYDLVALTNAQDVYAVDYVSETGESRATLLLVETKGDLYEHNKAACDRANGSVLSSLEVWQTRVGQTPPVEAIGASYRNSEQGTLDHSLTFKLYPRPDGTLQLHSQWLNEDYPEVPEQAAIVNGQLWASNERLARQLFAGLLSKLETSKGLHPFAWTENAADEQFGAAEDLARLDAERSKLATTLPAAYFSHGHTLGGQVTLQLQHLSGQASPSLRLVFLGESGELERIEQFPLNNNERWTLRRSLFEDVTAELLLDNKVVDRMWLSDGAWTTYHDGIWGGKTHVELFSTHSCALRSPTIPLSTDSVALSGCANSIAQVSDFAGVARYLSAPLATAPFSALTYHAVSLRPFEVCLEDPHTLQRRCAEQPASSIEGRWYTVDWDEFANQTNGLEGVPAQVKLISFASTEPGHHELEIAGLTLLAAPTIPHEAPVVSPQGSNSFWGCSFGPSLRHRTGGPFSLFGLSCFLGLAGLLMKRTRRHPSPSAQGKHEEAAIASHQGQQPLSTKQRKASFQ